MKLSKNLDELLEAGVITPQTAQAIQQYYDGKSSSSSNRLLIAFGILGALLIGLGIILILAHNWDHLPKSAKIFFAFLPLAVGQISCAYVLFKKDGKTIWKESASIFLFFAVGACISLIGQIYNIPGNLSSFVFTWMLLCLPLIYVMKSSVASLLYLIGITYYPCQMGYWAYPPSESLIYWGLLALVLPHYYLLIKKSPQSNFTTFHHWFVSLSLTICLGLLAHKNEQLMYVSYFSLFGIFYLIGMSKIFRPRHERFHSYKIVGVLGTLLLLLVLSFKWFWLELKEKNFAFNEVVSSPEFLVSVALSLIGLGMLYFLRKNKSIDKMDPLAYIFVLFVPIFFIGIFSPFAVLLPNILLLILGIFFIKRGASSDQLSTLNFGLLIISALVVCRFFDVDISFILKGILFILVGIGFFVANYQVLKKRRSHE